MGVATARRLYQLVDDMVGRRLVGVAHSEVDDVLARRSRLLLQITDDIEYVRRKALDALEFSVHGRRLEKGANTERRGLKKGPNSTESAPPCQREGGASGHN